MSETLISGPAVVSDPLSHQQLRLAAVGMRNRCTVTVLVEGQLDTARLERALDALVADEPMLRQRMRGAVVGGRPMPMVESPETPTTGRLLFYEAGEADSTADPAVEPDTPMAVRGVREAADRHRLEVSFSPFCADGRAAIEALGLLVAAYEDPEAVETDRMPYEEVAEIFQTLLESDETEEGRDHWLWFRPPASPRWRSEGAFEPIAHSVGVVAAPSEAFLLACWSVVLLRREEEGAELIGRGVAGRTYDEVVDCIGPLAKVVPTRTDAARSEPFARLLEQIEEAFEEHADYQDFFVLPVEGPAPTTFPILFDALELPAPIESADGTRWTIDDVEPWVDRSLLRLRCVETTAGWRLVLHGDPEVYDAPGLEVLGEQLVEVVRHAAEAPETPIGRLSLLPPAHRRALLVDGNATAVPLEEPLCIHRLVAARAAEDPQRTALLWGEESWTYARLDGAAATLAGALRRLGAGPETMIGVLLPRSPEMVVALLGVLRSGAAMLPLDPDMVEERRSYMVGDSGCRWILTHRPLLGDGVAIGHGAEILDLAESSWQEGAEPLAPSSGDGKNLAYVLYTSGSTGRPKGVEVPHEAVVSFLRSMAEVPGLGRDDRLAAVTTISFDISVLELFLPLMVGAEILLVERSVAIDGGALGALIDQRRPTVMQATPSTWRMLLAAGWTPHPGLKILSGGEALPGTLAVDLLAAGADLWNVYGPTETTIWSSVLHAAELPRDDGSLARRASLPLGHPIANTELYILTPDLRPAAYGETGELVIGGLGVTRGYHGLPAMTAERFLPDPFGPRPGGRMYRTGDLVRRLPGQTPDYLGRTDFQVKIRGHRIELGEIEVALRAHPGVSEAVVVARPDAVGVTQLLAYFLRPAEGEAPAGDALREHLAASLPGAMVPAHFIALDAFPLTANNKIDRRALPDPEPTVSDAPYEAPRPGFEERLAELWREVLGVERVGRGDNFFALGGHSLSGTVLIHRTRTQLGIGLTLATLFDAPTLGQFAVAAQARRLEEASEEELAAVFRRLGKAPATPAELASGPVEALETVAAELGFSRHEEERIAVQPRDGELPTFPMSFAQQRLWFIDRYLGESPAYNLVGAARIRGPLAHRPLEEAVNHIVRRHEVLRTTYGARDEEQVQTIHPYAPVAVPLVDVGDEPDPEGAALALASEEARQPFDLEIGPVLRARLVRLADDDHIVIVNIHHIASDAWSNDIFIEELGYFYRAIKDGGEGTDPRRAMPALPIQYADFSVWQRQWLDSGILEPQIEVWRSLLEEAEEFPLPLDRPRPRQQTFDGGRLELRLPAVLEEAVEALGKAHGVTPFMILLGALAVVFYRYSGHRQLVFGSPFAGRRRGEVEGLIGFFINNLPIPVELAPERPFLHLLEGVRRNLLTVQDNQDLPFERLLDELAVERDPSKNPVYQVVFNYQNAAPSTLEITPELSMEPLEPDPGAAKFDLTLALQGSRADDRKGFVGFLEYKPSLFDEQTITTLAEHFERVLEGIVTSRGTLGPAALPLLSETTRASLVSGAHGQPAPAPVPEPYSEVCIHDRFETAAERYPERIAVSFEGQSLSYGELARRARQAATLLRRRGVGPEVRVGLCFERGLDLVVAILGVLRAGGTYVPLDPTYPEERLRFIAEDAGMRLILTQEGCEERLPEALVHFWRPEELEKESPVDTPAGTVGAHAAYIIYTSGSTGKPKGVVIPHHNVLRLFSSTRPWFDFGPEDVWTLFHSYAFDFSVWELWGALFFGGRLVVVPYWVSRSREDFYQLLLDEGVTVLNQSPSAFSQLVHYQSQKRPVALPTLPLRLVIFGGEALDMKTLPPWFERQGDERPRLVNMYGITETTVHVTYRPLSRDDVDYPDGSPVGVTIPDLAVYVLDDFLEPVPFGCPGEVYVGGAGGARGYLDRPALTAQRFLPDPFGGRPGGRLYRSGDKALLRTDGDIAFLGRLDKQVQIRGFRVELGEVQAALAEHPGIHQTVVITSPDRHGDPMLVAFFVPVALPPSQAELRQFLAEKIPGYMIPRQMLPLEELPLTSHGKLDRRALPEPEELWAAGERQVITFETPLEETLAKAWEEVLGLEGVGPEDNFFDLGGDSILGIRLVAEAKHRGLELSLQALFQCQTIRALAAELEEAGDGVGETVGTPPFGLIPEGIRRQLPDTVVDAYPTTRLQLGMIYEMQLEPETLPYHNVDSVRYRAPLDRAAFLRAVDLLVERHDILRTGFELSSYGEPIQLVYRQATLPTLWQDLRGLDEAGQRAITDRYIEEQRHAAFDLAKPALLRFAIHRLSDEIFRFTVTECHAILDGWSLTLLMRDVFTFHEALRRDPDFVPPALPEVRFRDFVRLELESLENSVSSHFWRAHLDDFSLLSIPGWPMREEPDPEVASLIHRFQVDAPRVERLKRLARRAQVPLKTVFLTAHMRTLALLGGRRDVLTGVQSNGRPEVEGGDAITGLFLNSLPLRVTLRSGDWVDLLRQVYEVEQEAMPHRRYPLADIQRDVEEQPLFETFFNYVSFHVAEGVLETGSIEILPDSTHLEPTHFPLSVDFNLSRLSGELMVQLECNKALYPMAQVLSMARLYDRVLEAMADLDAPVLDHFALSFVDDDERREMARHLVVPASYTVGERTFLDLLAEQMAERPDQEALVQDGSERLTYLEFDRATRRLAKVLRDLGIRPEVPVGLFHERSYQAMIGMIGILRSGGVYVPMDPTYPMERTTFLIEDAGIRLVLTREELAPLLPEGLEPLIFEAGDWGFEVGDWAHATSDDVPNGVGLAEDLLPENLAYTIYTSGSTGVPKGVGISHRSLANLCFCLGRRYGMEAGVRGLQIASLSFDTSIEEILPVFARGGTLVVPPTHHPLSGAEYVALIERQQAQVANFPTAYWHAVVLEMVESGLRMPSCFELQIVGGEKAKPAILEKWRAFGACEDFSWLNTYGPTEASVSCTYFAVHPGQVDEALLEILPIGKSFESFRHYVLDRQLHQVPIGVVGQLFVAGVGLARGYLGRPSRTATSFLPDPLVDASLAGQRMYATGDLARVLPDGNIEYIGRADFQVKIRGFRIEMGEVEAVFLSHPAVANAIVTVFEPPSGDKRLVVHYTSPEGPLDVSGLESFLGGELPEYMVPKHFVHMDELPLTPNGKVDRRALPAPEIGDEARVYLAPETDTERILAEMWGAVLFVDPVSRDDDFFALGGHSLLATQVVSRIREAFRVDLPLRDLFEHSVLHDLAAHLDGAGGTATTAPPPMVPVARTGSLPLSFAQERLWFLDQLTPGDASYNMPDAVRLLGPLDVVRLQACFAEIVRRHEVLRTVFVAEEGEPEQRILEPFVPPLPVTDLRHLPTEERRRAAELLAREEAARPFGLERLPLLRTRLLRLDDEEYWVLLTMHHIVSDGWSSGVLIRELETLWNAEDWPDSGVSPLEPLGLQYVDFAAWQRQWLRGEALEAQLDFWRRQVAGADTVLDLPTDRPRPPVQSNRGGVAGFRLTREASARFLEVVQGLGATPFMGLMALWQLLLGRYGGQRELLVGTPIANRHRVEVEPLIGFFVNTLVIRASLGETQTYDELVRNVRRTSLDAFAHQDLPFEKLVDAVVPDRDLSRSPLYQAMFVVQNAATATLHLEGLVVEPLAFESDLTNVDLGLNLVEGEDGLFGSVDYSSDLFDRTTIERLIGHFTVLLSAAAEDPQQSIFDLPMLTPAERSQLTAWSDGGGAEAPLVGTFLELFDGRVDRAPDAPALLGPGTQLDFRTLAARIEALARILRRSGVGPEVPVAIGLDRSPERVIAALAVLRAGGCYLPVDTQLPGERKLYLLGDSGTRVLITHSALLPTWPRELDLSDEGIVLIDALATVDPAETAAPWPVPHPEQLAYVMYTSGSTGRPRGVGVTHRNLAGHCAAMVRQLGLTAADRMLQFSSFSFDISVEEIFPTLAAGAALVVPEQPHVLGADELAQVVRDFGVTILDVPTAYWHAWTAELEAERAVLEPPLRLVIVGGERANPALYNRWRALAPPSLRWINTYGPTETTVTATRFVPATDDPVVDLPIGRPVSGYVARVLDPRLRPVPIGIPGELYLGGIGTTRGYRGRPAATAEVFVPDPDGMAPGSRLYRTRDRVRFLADGELEFLGRTDFQLKIRGFRVDVGEVEERLSEHPAVADAVVVPFTTPSGDTRLAAYSVAQTGRVASTEDLRRYLAEQLPEYMVPAAFVELDALPTGATGKVDRRALPEPRIDAAEAAETAPRNPLEQRLASIWAELLGISTPGIHRSFFELGGHSLLATQVASRVRRDLGLEMEVRTLFEAPTLAELAARLAGPATTSAVPEPPPLVAAPAGVELPLSFAQERLWFLDRLEPGSAAYNISDAVRVRGNLDPELWRRCWNELIRRHAILRTVFPARDGVPVQVVEPAAEVDLQLSDLRRLAPEEALAEARRMAREEATRSFDLAAGPLLRTRLLTLAEGDHVVLLTLHHIVSDGWSTGILIRELGAIFGALAGGTLPTLEPLPIQYGDFAYWQRSWLRGEALAALEGFWVDRLQGAPKILDLPTDRPRPAVPSHRGATVTKPLGDDRLAAVEAFAAGRSASPFMVLLAAWGGLLGRLASQPDLLIGSPIANRNRMETEGLIGFFVNTLTMRVDGRGNPDFETLLARVRELALGAFAHQDMPFELLVDVLEPSRDLSRSPIFQVLFAVQNTPSASLSLPGLELSDFAVDDPSAKYELGLVVETRGEAPSLTATFFADLFDDTTVDRWLDYLLRLVDGVLEEPARPLASFSLLSPDEEAQVVLVGADTRGREATLHGLFEAQAERTPQRTALVYEGESLTYDALELRSRALATELRRRGVGAEMRVGICLERSLDLPIALYGTLRAGAVFVPMDPGYPAERLAFMAADSKAELILASAESAAILAAAGVEISVLRLDEVAPGPTRLPSADIDEERAAYVIYTSGSTGRPKGVLVPHRGIVNHIRWMQRLYPLVADDRVLQKTAYSFDASLWELFTPLSCGASLVLARPGGQKDMAYMARVLQRESITALRGVPSFYRALVETGAFDALPALRLVISGGEPLTADLSRRLESPGRQVVNVYGPTEASIVSTAWPVEPAAVDPIPIGVAVDRARLVVLDPHGWPTLPGAAGELCVGGAPLARGYLGRPALSAERFVPDLRGDGERLYRTGDLVRRRADGALIFLGRIDQQVKLRGFRIELGEIETALRRHPAVDDAVAVVREDRPGDQRLVAYWVGDHGTAEPLRRHLAEQLPEHMVPGVLVRLDALPLLPNGKVDRRRLPVPSGLQGKEGGTAPRTSLEGLLADLWSQVLGLAEGAGDSWGIHDDFFSLGGHSLLAVQVMTRIGATVGVDLPVRTLFEAPTVAELAPRVEAALAAGEGSTPPPLEARPRGPESPLSFAQERLWFLDRLEPDSAAYNIADASRLHGPLDIALLERALGEIIRRHEVLRTVFTHRDGRALQVVRPAEPFVATRIELTAFAPEARLAEARRLATEEALRPFDLERGPLLRLMVLELAPEDHVVVINMHHIVSDGWSMGVFSDELGALLRAFGNGEASPLPELSVQYADFARWQRDWLQGEVLERQLEYWRRQLDSVPRLELPTDRPRPSDPRMRASTVVRRWNPALRAGIEHLGRESSSTLFMTLMAGIGWVLGRWGGQDDLTLGTPVANRRHPALEELIGFFVNTLVVRARLAEATTFEELSSHVREVSLEAFAHQDIPFEQLVEAIAPERHATLPPLFQVIFALQNAPRGAGIFLPGVEAESFSLGESAAKLDLVMVAATDGDALEWSAEYTVELFDRTTIQRLLAALEFFFEQVVDDPRRPLRSLDTLRPSERHALLVEWNDTATAFPGSRTLHALFREEARRRPSAIALELGERTLTYDELRQRATRLAHALVDAGVSIDQAVALCVERSPELVVAILAILEAGGAYLPVEADMPESRRSEMLRSADVSVVVGRGELGWAEEGPWTVIDLDRDADAIARRPSEPLAERARPESLAYVMFTSGSTGVPKGVAVPHRAVIRLVRETSFIDFGPEEVFLLMAPVAFDASTLELWGPLLNGGRLVIMPPGPVALGELARTLVERRITTLWLTAGLFPQMVEHHLDALGSVRQLLAGGDVLPVPQVRRVVDGPGEGGAGHTRMIDGYGPTECTTFTCTYRVPAGPIPTSIPIGRPIANTRIFVLDDDMRPVARGLMGDLHVAGPGLARGYQARPALTAECFVPSPFGDGERLYRTGDRVRYLADGRVEFHGRQDHQVKVRGFRIELGEIETHLAAHPAVERCVVVAREQRLVAYCVPAAPNAELEPETLKARLAEHLPDYMVPSLLVTLEELPLNANGKVDRRALPEPSGGEATELAGGEPTTALEKILVELWAEVLGRETLGVHDDFFTVGGHSLMAVQLIARIASVVGVELPLQILFDRPTVAELAPYVESALSDGTAHDTRRVVVEMQTGGAGPPFALVHPVGGHVFSYVALARALGPEVNVYGLQALPRDETMTLETLATEYVEALRQSYPEGPYRLGGWSFGGVVAFEMARQLVAAGATVESLVLIDSYLAESSGISSEGWIDRLASFAVDLAETRGVALEPPDFDYRTLDEEEAVRVFHRWALETGLLPATVDLERLRELYGMFSRHRIALEGYTPGSVEVPAVLYRATAGGVEDGGARGIPQVEAWEAVLEELEIHSLAIDHFGVVRPPHVLRIADDLRRRWLPDLEKNEA